ncbi:MAG: S-layer homology domain-containing protein [Oscillospiraceae bacterium]|nr:S-layer homology domain-containing protein [Oscillospiraceae bacterium]
MKKRLISWLLLLALAVTLLPGGALAADEPAGSLPDEDPTPAESEAPEPSEASEPNEPPEPTEAPTASPEPTEAPEPSETPEPPPEPTEPGMDAFLPSEGAASPRFTDVAAGDWYAEAVSLLFRLDLVKGMTETTFAPDRALTAGECAALIVRIYALYHGLTPELTVRDGEEWYDPWLRAATEYGLMPGGWSGDAVLTRLQALYLMYRALPASELGAIRSCPRIPGLYATHAQYDEVRCLYDAGVLNGTDEYGTLDGDAPVTRAQYITLLARLIDPAQRISSPILPLTGMAAFDAASAPTSHPFTDIPQGIYYDRNVGMLYHMGLVKGIAAQTYAPDYTVTRTQVVILAVRVYELYHGLDRAPKEYDPETFLALGREYGILPRNWAGLDQNATRAEVAYLIAHTLPSDAFLAVKQTTSIPDVPGNSMYFREILLLYRAGIVGGSDSAGTFHGESSITRAELAAMFARVVDPAQRLHVDLSPVEAAIRGTLASYAGTWSVFVLDVRSGERVSINPAQMPSASLIKLYVMGAVLEALENGTLANSSVIQSQLRAMITWSSNDAWKYLATQLGGGNYLYGMSLVNAWCDRNGYPNSGRRSIRYLNATTPEEAGLFLQRVVEGTNVSPAASAQMLALLRDQQVTYKLPAGVPSGVPTANKTGELNEVQNDAAIIFAPFGTYILVVQTQNASIWSIRTLSSVVYAAMERALT